MIMEFAMGTAEIARFLNDNTAWVREFSEAEIAALASAMRASACPAGEYLFREGDAEDYMAFIVQGDVQIIKKNDHLRKKVVVALGAGDVLGEIALIDDKGRSASAFASSDLRLLILDREHYHRIVAADLALGYKILVSIARLICNRLRETTAVNVYTDFKEYDEPGLGGQATGRERFGGRPACADGAR
jgi:CRP/FNR family transcriptional regulator, cyclic AMP receptor protein